VVCSNSVSVECCINLTVHMLCFVSIAKW